MGKKKCLLIYNPVASNFTRGKLSASVDMLKEHGYDVDKRKSEYSGHVIELVKQLDPDYDLLITMGGDGTVSEAFKGFQNIKQHSVYAHISAGTTNDMASNLGLNPKDPLGNLAKLLKGSPGKWDMIEVNGEPVSYISAFGEVTQVPYEVNAKLKRFIGYAAYVVSAVPAIIKKFKRLNMTVTANGVTQDVECVLGLISNAKGMGGITLFPYADPSNGTFEVVFLKKVTSKMAGQLFSEFLKNNVNLCDYPEEIINFTTDEMVIDFNGNPPDKAFDNDGNKAEFELTPENCRVHIKITKQINMLYPPNKEK